MLCARGKPELSACAFQDQDFESQRVWDGLTALVHLDTTPIGKKKQKPNWMTTRFVQGALVWCFQIQNSLTLLIKHTIICNLEVLASLSKPPVRHNLLGICIKRLLTWTLTVPWGSCTCSRVASMSSATTNPEVNLRGLSDSPVGSMIFALALWSCKRQNDCQK